MLLAYWTFLSSPMLWWSAAAIVPLAIHLWSRRRFKEVEWAAMRFLLAAVRQNARRLQWEQLLLLLLRMTALVLFALALANPLDQSPGQLETTLATGRTHYYLVVDTSYSMGTQTQRGTRLDLARGQAKKSIEGARNGDQFSLFRLSRFPQSVFRQPSYSPAQVNTELDNLSLDHTGADLSSTLARLDSATRLDDHQDETLRSKRVYFFTDLDANTWSVALDPQNREILARLSQTCDLRVFPTDEEESRNVAVRDLRASSALITVGQDVAIYAELENLGDKPVTRPVEFLVDNVVSSKSSIDLTPKSTNQVSFMLRSNSPGERIVEVRIAPDSVSLDNQRWSVVRVLAHINVLCVEGQPGSGRFVDLALASTGSQSSSSFRLERVSENLWSDRLSNDLHCVVLCDVSSITPTDVSRLRGFVAQGGCLVVSMGEQVDVDRYNALFADQDPNTSVQMNLLGGTLEQVMAKPPADAPYLFVPDDYSHPIIDPFRGHERSGLLTAPTWKYIRLQSAPNVKIVLRYDTGDPAIVDTALGDGRIIFCASALSYETASTNASSPRPWSALSSWPCFPPLMHEMIRYGAAPSQATKNVLVGDVLRGKIAQIQNADSLLIHLPGDETAELTIDKSNAKSEWSFSGTDRVGVYRLAGSASAQDQAAFAVNVDTRESESSRLSLGDLPITPERSPTETLDETSLVEGERVLTPNTYRYLLVVVFAILICESLLASKLSVGWGTTPSTIR